MDEKELSSTLAQFEKLGRLDEDPALIDARLHAAVEAAAEKGGLHSRDLGLGEWAKDTITKIKAAVHKEICDPAAGKVKAKYLDLLNKGTSKEAVSTLGSIISTVMAALHLTPLAVSAVVVYLAIWIIKIGLNSWCSLPAGKI